MTAPALIGLLGGVLGGIGGGIEQGNQNDLTRQQLALQRLLGLANVAGSQAGTANQIGNQMQLAPLRDQAAYALAGRLGMSPHAFQPRDVFNGGSVSSNTPTPQGGIDMNALAQRQQQYTPGAGGISGDQSLQQAILGQLGYQRQPGQGTSSQRADGGQYGYQQPTTWGPRPSAPPPAGSNVSGLFRWIASQGSGG